MAFIDLDEFIYPKYRGGAIIDVVDEILSDVPNAAGLAINWQIFGSNGQEKADYSRGVLERFTRRAQSDWAEDGFNGGNVFRKTIDNPRLIRYRFNPHCADYFNGKSAVNSNGEYIGTWYGNKPILSDKIVINHYYTKSKEEFLLKQKKGRATGNTRGMPSDYFYEHDRNEIFDDGILKYRAIRAKNFSFESDESRNNRVVNALVRTLIQTSPEDSLVGKLETFLTCRAVAEKFQIKIGDNFAEEYALAWIYRTLLQANPLTYTEIQMFLKALPKILVRPFQICKDLKALAQDNVIPSLCETLKNGNIEEGFKDWMARTDLSYIQQLLRLIK